MLCAEREKNLSCITDFTKLYQENSQSPITKNLVITKSPEVFLQITKSPIEKGPITNHQEPCDHQITNIIFAHHQITNEKKTNHQSPI